MVIAWQMMVRFFSASLVMVDTSLKIGYFQGEAALTASHPGLPTDNQVNQGFQGYQS